jgi:hypothetical protein
MGVQAMLDRNEELQLTWPPAHLTASALRQALAARAGCSPPISTNKQSTFNNLSAQDFYTKYSTAPDYTASGDRLINPNE